MVNNRTRRRCIRLPQAGLLARDPQQYNELYTSTARAARDVLPHGLVGGPAVTSSGLDFLRQFLDYTSLGAAGEMRSPSSTT
jgi:hypothetical protein